MLSVFDSGTPPPCPAPFNLADEVLAAGRDRPDRIAVAVLSPAGAERWSFARLTEAVRGTAGGLLARGLGPGDRVLMRLGNTVDFPILFLGAIAAGLVPVPTSAQHTATETTAVASRIGPKLVAAAPGIALPDADMPVIDLDALRALRGHPPAETQMGDPDRPAYAVLSSGTSGAPHVVLHAHRAILARRMMHGGWYGLTPEDRLLHAGAFNWTYTLGTGLLDPWTLGATALIPAEGVDPAALPLLMKRHDATIFAAAPGIYRKLLNRHAKLDLPKLRHGLSAGENLSDQIRARWDSATGTPLHEAFGMSECSTFISGCPSDPAPPGTLGRPQPGRRVAILGADRAPAPLNQPGTIAIDRRDPGLMLGYRDAPHETASRIAGDWFLTGDTGTMDETGAVTYLGRDDDMINAGGIRVSPVEIEEALTACPGIDEAAAVELRVKADASVIAVFYAAATDPGEAAIAEHCATRLARYKRPRVIRRLDALPRGANGKLLRRRLREAHEERFE